MGMTIAPKKKVKLFDNIRIRGNYVGVLRPIQEEESNIEIPEAAQENQGLDDALARVACIGDEVEDLKTGDAVLTSMYMQQPHQVVQRTDKDGNEYHMFVIDSEMIVGVVDLQEDNIREMVTKGSV